MAAEPSCQPVAAENVANQYPKASLPQDSDSSSQDSDSSSQEAMAVEASCHPIAAESVTGQAPRASLPRGSDSASREATATEASCDPAAGEDAFIQDELDSRPRESFASLKDVTDKASPRSQAISAKRSTTVSTSSALNESRKSKVSTPQAVSERREPRKYPRLKPRSSKRSSRLRIKETADRRRIRGRIKETSRKQEHSERPQKSRKILKRSLSIPASPAEDAIEEECPFYYASDYLVYSTPTFLEQKRMLSIRDFKEKVTTRASPLCITAVTENSAMRDELTWPCAAMHCAQKNLATQGVVAVLILTLNSDVVAELLQLAKKLSFKLFQQVLTVHATDCSSVVHVWFFSRNVGNKELSNLPLLINGTPSSLLDEKNSLAFGKIEKDGDRWRSIGLALEFIVKRFGRLVENGEMLSEVLDASGTSQVPVTPVAIQYGLHVVSLSRTTSEIESIREDFEIAVERKKLHPVEFLVGPEAPVMKSTCIDLPKKFVLDQAPPWRQSGKVTNESNLFGVEMSESEFGIGLCLTRPVQKNEIIVPCWGRIVTSDLRFSIYKDHDSVMNLDFLHQAGFVSEAVYLIFDNRSLGRFVNSPENAKDGSKDGDPNCYFSPEYTHKSYLKEFVESCASGKDPKNALRDLLGDPKKVIVIRASMKLDPACGKIELLAEYGSQYWLE